MGSINIKDDKYWGQLSNPAYWEKRTEELDKYLTKTQKKALKEAITAYKSAFANIDKEVSDFLLKYAVDNKIDYTVINQVLSPIDLGTYNMKMEELRAMYRDTGSEYILREIKELEARAYITRQIALMDSINVELCKASNDFEKLLNSVMADVFKYSFEDISDLLGILNPTMPTEAIKKILEYPYHGKMFADSIWDNKKNALINHINKNLVQGIIRGDSIQKMSKQLKDDLKVFYYQAERLIRTETNYAMNQGHLEGYKKSEVVSEYEYLAYVDSRTSKLCKNQDRKVYKLEDAVVGVNYPPLHPNCRSTVMPVLNDW